MDITDRYILHPYPAKDAVERLISLSLGDGRDATAQGDILTLAATNYKALSSVKSRTFEVGGCTYHVQFNPARITSSAAKVDPKSIQERKCFLCPANLPPQQKGVPFGQRYLILVNPFPIFPRHLTIPDVEHLDQRIFSRIADMLDLAKELDDYVLFYNGPKCGASAPDHFHFQAGSKGFLPIEKEWRHKKAGRIAEYRKAALWFLNDAPRATLVIEAEDKYDAANLFMTIHEAMRQGAAIPDDEPMMNVLAWHENNKWIVCVFARRRHRPECYSAGGDKNILISPAAVDMGGVFITPLEKDFNKITAKDIYGILEEVCISPGQFHQLRQQIKAYLADMSSTHFHSNPSES